jgi:hypothetical protein
VSDQILAISDDFLGDLGPPRVLAVLAAIILLGDESPIPRQNGLWREENGGLLQELSGQLFRLRSESHPLMIVEQNALVWKSACKRDPRRGVKIGIENGPTAVISVG